MSKLSLDPQPVCDGLWYYEDNGGIDLIIDFKKLHPLDNPNATKRVMIPWKKLRASLKRKDASRVSTEKE